MGHPHGLVKTEVDRAVGRMGFVREEELAAVRRHVQLKRSLETVLGKQLALRDRQLPPPPWVPGAPPRPRRLLRTLPHLQHALHREDRH